MVFTGIPCYFGTPTSIPPFFPSLISLVVSVDVKHHVYILIQIVCHFFKNIDSKRHGFNTDRKQIGKKKSILAEGPVLNSPCQGKRT